MMDDVAVVVDDDVEMVKMHPTVNMGALAVIHLIGVGSQEATKSSVVFRPV